MKKSPKEATESHGVRLPISYWRKLRGLMTYHGGRGWLEKAIDREFKKIVEPHTAAPWKDKHD